MVDVLKQLNNESVLLMYQADELAAEDRMEVEQMLATDAGLRDELSRIEAAQQVFEDSMARLDAQCSAGSESASMRRVGAAMRRHMLERAAASPAPAAERNTLRYPAWAYPAAVAAVALVGFLTTWGLRPADPIKLPAIAFHGKPGATTTSEESERLADSLAKNLQSDNMMEPATSLAKLNAVEEQVAELRDSRADDARSYFGFSDTQ